MTLRNYSDLTRGESRWLNLWAAFDVTAEYLGTFTLEVNDRAVAARAVVEHVRERLVLDHRCCILM